MQISVLGSESEESSPLSPIFLPTFVECSEWNYKYKYCLRKSYLWLFITFLRTLLLFGLGTREMRYMFITGRGEVLLGKIMHVALLHAMQFKKKYLCEVVLLLLLHFFKYCKIMWCQCNVIEKYLYMCLSYIACHILCIFYEFMYGKGW